MIGRLVAWLSDPASWSGPDGITTRIVEHLVYSAVVVVVAALIAIPLGLLIGHTGKGRWLISSTNAARAIPSLGLLFAVALWLGPRLSSDLAFILPSLIVLVVLAMPPLLSGAYAGVGAVDPAARDAAYGIGMTPREVLLGVEVPCALPLLMSGLRSATLQVVATATIASYISLGGLGRFLIDGLASNDYAQVAGGALLVAVLALLVDGVLAVVQRLVVSPGLRLDAHGRAGTTRKDARSADTTDAGDQAATTTSSAHAAGASEASQEAATSAASRAPGADGPRPAPRPTA